MEDDKSKTKNERTANKDGTHLSTITHQDNGLLLSIILASVICFMGSVVYFTSFIPWLKLEFKSEIQKLIVFSKIIVILFRGDTKGEMAKNTLYSNLYENAREAHERIVNIDWLYWTMLFLPFYIAYALIQESFLKLRENVRYLKEDCKLKNNFINWQGSMHVALHQRIAELRVEVKTLTSMLEAYRQNAREKELQHKFGRKLQEGGDSRETEHDGLNVISNESTKISVAKKNKSDSLIEERRDSSEVQAAPRLKVRPKTEESRCSAIGLTTPKKCLSPTWMEAKKRLQERSKEILKSRVDTALRAKEAESNQQQAFPTDNPTVLPAEKRIARSKFTSRKSLDESKSLMLRDTKSISKRPDDEYKTLAHKNVISELKARNKSHETSVSAVDLLQPHQNINKISTKKRSLSEAAAGKDFQNVEDKNSGNRTSDTQEIISRLNFGNEDDIVSKLGLEGIGKVKSYTEIFKKRVHVPKSGRAPEITIEGKRRWCF